MPSSSYTLHRSPRRKRSVAMHIDPDGSLHVMAPMRTSQKWVESFIKEKERWIARRRTEAKIQQEAKETPLKDGSVVSFLGKQHKITFAPTDDEDVIPLTIHTPPDSPEHSEEITLALRLWYKKQARAYFPERSQFWSEQMKLEPARVTVASPQKQWGSCSPDNVIRLNWRLIVMPPEIVDYVIVHEIAHIKHKNHGKWFWGLVGKHIPDFKQRRATLREWEKRHPSSF